MYSVATNSETEGSCIFKINLRYLHKFIYCLKNQVKMHIMFVHYPLLNILFCTIFDLLFIWNIIGMFYVFLCAEVIATSSSVALFLDFFCCRCSAGVYLLQERRQTCLPLQDPTIPLHPHVGPAWGSIFKRFQWNSECECKRRSKGCWVAEKLRPRGQGVNV